MFFFINLDLNQLLFLNSTCLLESILKTDNIDRTVDRFGEKNVKSIFQLYLKNKSNVLFPKDNFNLNSAI